MEKIRCIGDDAHHSLRRVIEDRYHGIIGGHTPEWVGENDGDTTYHLLAAQNGNGWCA